MITVKELRQKYLDFFKKKEHAIVPSASLVPENDPTTLFTSAGMQPMIPYLLGESHPEGKRVVDSQKCFRTQDIAEVGDNRHTTFFEMLGNWSFGDYFKKEEIVWMFSFLTKELGLDPKRIYITCFRGREDIGISRDEETAKLWQKQFKTVAIEAKIVADPEDKGLQAGRIFYYDDTKNWWSRAGIPAAMPEGEPGGPDSEIFWDFGEELGYHEKSEWKNQLCHVNCDCGRFLEIGNNVFMGYVKKESGFELLENKNIDFGGGLERMVAAVNNEPDIFNIDVFAAAKAEVEEISGEKYGADEAADQAFRVILDHLRAATFLIVDGAVPDNKDQGYFTRRLIRRAIRYGHNLGIEKNFCTKVANHFINAYADDYPQVLKQKEVIFKSFEEEETKFRSTLTQGLKEMKKFGKKMTAKEAFYLYQSFGFPLELINEELDKAGVEMDEEEFNKEFNKHQNISRQGAEHKFKGGLAGQGEMEIKYHTATHLLHAALRQVLGDHVEQKGSNITDKRLRFDFTHPEKMTTAEKQEVEDLVNQAIEKDLIVNCEEMNLAGAKAKGALGFFEDKYGDKVKVYTMGDFSSEICGGPHVEKIGELGHFKIKKETSSSAGIRRIKAILE